MGLKMSKVVGVPADVPLAEREAAFNRLWRRASDLAPGRVNAVGGRKVRVPDDIADQLNAPPEKATTPAPQPAPGKTEPEVGKPARKAPAKKAPARKKAAPRKAAAKKAPAARKAAKSTPAKSSRTRKRSS